MKELPIPELQRFAPVEWRTELITLLPGEVREFEGAAAGVVPFLWTDSAAHGDVHFRFGDQVRTYSAAALHGLAFLYRPLMHLTNQVEATLAAPPPRLTSSHLSEIRLLRDALSNARGITMPFVTEFNGSDVAMLPASVRAPIHISLMLKYVRQR